MKDLKLSHTFDFSHAMRLAKSGVPVSPVTGDFIDRVTGIENKISVKAQDIWSPENRRIGALLKGPEGLIDVLPYTTKMTRNGIINYIPTNEDLYEDWMHSDIAARCTSIQSLSENTFELEFERIDSANHLSHHLPFWMLYDQNMIGYHHNAIFIGGQESANWVNALIFHKLSEIINIRNVNKIINVIDVDSDHQIENYQDIIISPNDWDLDTKIKVEDAPINIFIDVDSLNTMNLLNGENALESVKAFCYWLAESNPLVNWVSFSLEEELFNSNNIRKLNSEPNAAADETYALRG